MQLLFDLIELAEQEAFLFRSFRSPAALLPVLLIYGQTSLVWRSFKVGRLTFLALMQQSTLQLVNIGLKCRVSLGQPKINLF